MNAVYLYRDYVETRKKSCRKLFCVLQRKKILPRCLRCMRRMLFKPLCRASTMLLRFPRRWRTYTQKLPWLVCRIDGEVVGYGYAAPHRTRAAYQWSVETSIYVAQEQHRHGIAGAIYAALFELLAMQGYYNIYVGITSPNERSMKFHKAMGFIISGAYQESINSVSGAMSSGWARVCVRMTAHRSRPFRSRRLRTVRW